MNSKSIKIFLPVDLDADMFENISIIGRTKIYVPILNEPRIYFRIRICQPHRIVVVIIASDAGEAIFRIEENIKAHARD